MLTEKINQVENENRRLLIRGSVSFTELTPRHPRLKEMFQELHLSSHVNQNLTTGYSSSHQILTSKDKPKPIIGPHGNADYVSSVTYIDAMFKELRNRKCKIKDLKK